ncbi:hypothetical protein VitviT2T_020192 [Vitis vinifera]|uniref:Disease resistance protein n=1 Tax=Vitis vinifera TaxID=29760 RepID=A0ABY9D5K7_VITVI|nr:putative disease resistance protein At3g14460 [Vitis vinifera]XP_059597426.1 putative disease resistance protein At3g14460 [Vitis vinifera]XP_059597427.1 putative disease resistance protein At3g14460 [Vitis vinifera]WKA01946.1 hypothetical protein VitviT2T_020192 [Vitis vinifera]|eukprot:XP_019079894.1 PREDICTED: putative disease resistance protein At3g14460 [Vitis vinifera]
MVLGSTGVDFTSLVALEIGQISNLSHIGEEFMRCLPALEDLSIKDCKEVRWLRLEKLGGLNHLTMCGCPTLISLEEQALPCNLQYLEIEGCRNLEKLPNEMQSLGSVTELIIEGCPKLVNILEKGWPPLLRKLHLFHCEGLEALPGDWMMMRMEGDNTNSLCVLESMEISSCPSLIFFPKGELSTSLTRLCIANCENVESLPEGIMHSCRLEKLDIFNCSSLTSFPRGELPSTLKELFVGSCGNLKLLPNFMQSLTSLVIRDCRNLNFQQHHMQNLTSLGNFTISKCQGLVSFLEGGLGFGLNLTHVEIEGCENLKMPLSE